MSFKPAPPSPSRLAGLLLLLAALGLVASACESSKLKKFHAPGERCAVDGDCSGVCLETGEGNDEIGDPILRCFATCDEAGADCPWGGSCTPAPGRDDTLFCPLTACGGDADCGLNASCVGADDGRVCACLENFYGDARTSCSVCAPQNDRPGCQRVDAAQDEVLGKCMPTAGGDGGDDCRRREDCPAGDFGCFGFLPAVEADPPCACADLRGKDVSAGEALDDLTGAFYDAGTTFPEGFDPTTSGALGPGAQLAGADLSGQDLRGADLSGANLEGADLSGANLEGANLEGANLKDADLSDANLKDASLKGADLEGANLAGANIEGANLAGANLDGVDLSGTTGLDPDDPTLPPWLRAGLGEDGVYDRDVLADAVVNGEIDPRSGDLEGADLAGTDLSGAGDLTGARFHGANLEGADLSGLSVAGADFGAANLRNADLSDLQAPDTVCSLTGEPCYDAGASCPGGLTACTTDGASPGNFVGADLTGANLSRAQLPSADFTGATLAGANLQDANLNGAVLVGPPDAEGNPGHLDMTGANLRGTALKGAKLDGAIMVGVRANATTDFTDASMKGVDLTDADLRGARLAGADLTGAIMRGILLGPTNDLTGAMLKGADLTEACMPGVSLQDQDLQEAILAGTNLVGANLQRTNFSKVDMRGVLLGQTDNLCKCYPEGGPPVCNLTRLRGAMMKDVDLSPYNGNPSDLRAVDLRGLMLEGADLRKAILDRTDMRAAMLKGADFSEATDLRTALLSAADLSSCNLATANLTNNEIREGRMMDADLTDTNLNGTQLNGADLSGAVLDRTRSNGRTSLRGARLDLTTISGCFQANLSDASLANATLLFAGLKTPSGKLFDPSTDFNCRINFEGALLPGSTTNVCGVAFPATWLELGRNPTDSVYLQDRLVATLPGAGDLNCAYLVDADLRGRDIHGAKLAGANLTGAKLGRSNIGVRANLTGVDLQGARLPRADLQWANLTSANLKGADLLGTNLKDSDLRKADLTNVILDESTGFDLAKYACGGADQRSNPTNCTRFPTYDTFRFRQLKMIGPETDLEGVDLGGYPGLNNPPVDLTGANLKGAKFVRTNLSGVNFTGANVSDGNFTAATLNGANFAKANAKKATFSVAALNSSTGFSGANLIEANFVGGGGTPKVNGALCSEDTTFDSASLAFVLVLDVSIKSSGLLIFPVITIELVPGWNVAGQCCFPLFGGIRIGC